MTWRDTELYAAWCRGYGEGLQTYAPELERLRAALHAINERASPNSSRTFDDCSRDLYWCASEARRALNYHRSVKGP